MLVCPAKIEDRSGVFSLLDSVDNAKDFVESGDSEHAFYALIDVCEGEAGAVVATIDFVADDLAHAGRIDVRDGRKIEDCVSGQLAGSEGVANDMCAAERHGAYDAQDYDIGRFAGEALDCDGVGRHYGSSVSKAGRISWGKSEREVLGE
jgi:hypothetical protein